MNCPHLDLPKFTSTELASTQLTMTYLNLSYLNLPQVNLPTNLNLPRLELHEQQQPKQSLTLRNVPLAHLE